jgi:tetratricopeptide (TPR) repeat protein
MTQPLVFISYSHEDEEEKEKLRSHLGVLGKAGLIDLWSDDRIGAGGDWKQEIDEAMAQAKVAILLVSANSLTSDFILDEEVPTLLKRREAEGLTVFPVIAKACAWETVEWLARMNVRPKNGRPVWGEAGIHVDEDLAAIAKEVAAIVRGAPYTTSVSQPDTFLDILDAMPLDEIPPIASLPPSSRMPFSPNPLFVGREVDLKKLAKAVKGGETAAIGQIAAATGLGGIGKTQLASEFVHRYGQYFAGGVFWLSFADPAAIPAEVASCGGRGYLNLAPDFEGLDLPTQMQLVLSAWQSPLPRLLVFDNCEEEELLAQWRPPHGGCRVLVTSRRAKWDAALGVQALALGVLSRAESVALLRKFRSNLTDDEANMIAEELGDLPLALHLAGSYLARYRHAVAPSDYLAQLRDKALLDHPSLQGRGATFRPTGHELHVARTFALSYDHLDAADPIDALARALLGRAAYFAPGEPIPRKLLVATLGRDDDPERALLAEDGLARLVELGLLEAEAEGALRLHRLVGAFVRGVAADAEAQGAVEEALLAEAPRLNWWSPNWAGYRAPLLTWQVHLRAVTDAAQKREDERAARLCFALGSHLNMIDDYAGARPYFERALRIREQVLGGEHPDTARSLLYLGSLLRVQGDLAGARPYLERALRIREQVLGGECPATAESLNNLGYLLQDMGDLAGARPYHERALRISEQVLGGEHPNTAASLNSLGLLLQDMGDQAGARPYFERALRIREQVLGEDHPRTAESLNNLGMLLQDMGNLAGARPYFERALRIFEAQLGLDHPYTRPLRNNLAILNASLKD